MNHDEPWLVGYARTRPDEDIEPQHAALRTAGCAPIFSDLHVLRRAPWPQLETALAVLRPGDTLVVCKLSRLGKTFEHLAETITRLHLRHIGFRSLEEDLDTTGPDGEQIPVIVDAFVETYHQLASENTHAGLAAARERGAGKSGRPKALSPNEIVHIRELLDQPGNTIGSVASLFGVSYGTVYRHVLGSPPPTGMDCAINR